MIAAYAALRFSRARSAAPPRVLPVTVESDADLAGRLVDALPFAAFTVDARGRVRVFNAAACELFGVDRVRAMGRALIEVVPPVELERLGRGASAGIPQTAAGALGAGGRE